MKRSAFTIVEMLVVIAIISVLAGLLLPAVNGARDQAKVALSQSNLRNLATAHGSYAASWKDRHFTLINDNIATYGSNATEAFSEFEIRHSQIAHPPIRLGWGEHPTLGPGSWGFPMGGDNHANFALAQPLNFSGSLQYGGSFRLPNVGQFNQYVSGRFYDPIFYAPKDGVVIDSLGGAFDDPGEFSFQTKVPATAGFLPAWSSYSMSPAAMFNPAIFRRNDPGDSQANGAIKDVWSLPRAFRSPTFAQASYAHLKTHMLEHHWLQNQRMACNPGFDGSVYDDCEPYYFNHAWVSTPVTLFFDGSVRLVGVDQATRDDGRIRAQSEIEDAGLWSRDTDFGDDGYEHEMAYDQSATSFHILTTDGIQGRDFTSSD